MTKAAGHVLALDQGTSSSRAIVFDILARPVASAQHELRSSFPQLGWVEQDADEIWRTQLRSGREALAAAGLAAADVAAIGITNQRETTIAWDAASGRPLAPAIVWQDRRTADRCAALRAEGLESLVRSRTGLLLDPYFSATKMAWLLDHLPDGHARAAAGELRLGTVDAWLVDRLTGSRTMATDVSNASRTMLLDLATRDWSPDQLRLFGVPAASLPEVRPTDGGFGLTDPEHFGAEIPVAAVVGDQQAALFGQLCLAAGQAKNTYGTGCFLLETTGSLVPAPPEGLLATIAWQRTAPVAGSAPIDDAGALAYALEGSVFVAGAAVRWLRDGLGIIHDADDVQALAASVPDSGGVVFVPAFAGLGAPYWDPDARGTITGVTAGTTSAHLARATLEAIAHQVVDLVAALEVGGAPHLDVLRADGGASSNDLLLQVQADLLGRPVERAAVAETTALGAALLAGRAVGVWAHDAELADLIGVGARFEPVMPASRRDAERARWAEAVARTRSRPA
ncbi:MAG: glycerol kinase GlpK [Candidatus Limnocylindrales bacterium]